MGFEIIKHDRRYMAPETARYVLHMRTNDVPGLPQARFISGSPYAEPYMCYVDIRTWRVLEDVEVEFLLIGTQLRWACGKKNLLFD